MSNAPERPTNMTEFQKAIWEIYDLRERIAQLEAERDARKPWSETAATAYLWEKVRLAEHVEQVALQKLKEANARIAALEAERDEPEWTPQSVIAMLADRIAEIRAERDGLKAEVARLREALEGD